MNLETTSADFRRAITLATKCVEKRSTIPILEAVRCHANGSFEAIGTDLDMSITATVKREPGPVLDFVMTSPRSVLQAISAGGDKVVSLGLKDGKANISSGALDLSVGTLSFDDFPNDLAKPLTPSFNATLSAAHIAQLSRVAGAMSTQETRYYLNGVHVRTVGPTTVRFEATDGHRLYMADVELPDAVGALGENIIIPRKTVTLLIDLARGATNGVRLTIGAAAIPNREDTTAPTKPGAERISVSLSERSAEVVLSSKLIDGTFPDVARVVPQTHTKQAVLKVADMRRALSAVSGHSRDIRATKLAFSADGGLTVLAAYVSVDIAASMKVPCTHTAGDFTIGFNGGYLASVLNAVRGEEVLFELNDEAAPMLIRNPADTAWKAILMPMRVV